MKQKLIQIYNTYRNYFPIIAPVILFDSFIIFRITSIPYLNLYARYVILFVIFTNWIIISHINKFDFATSLKYAFGFLIFSGILLLIKAEYFAEITTDMIFLIILSYKTTMKSFWIKN